MITSPKWIIFITVIAHHHVKMPWLQPQHSRLAQHCSLLHIGSLFDYIGIFLIIQLLLCSSHILLHSIGPTNMYGCFKCLKWTEIFGFFKSKCILHNLVAVGSLNEFFLTHWKIFTKVFSMKRVGYHTSLLVTIENRWKFIFWMLKTIRNSEKLLKWLRYYYTRWVKSEKNNVKQF